MNPTHCTYESISPPSVPFVGKMSNLDSCEKSSMLQSAQTTYCNSGKDVDHLKPQPGERVLYWGSGSPQAWRVLIVLEEKGIEFRSVCVSFSCGILKSPFFQQLNPRMRVPIFYDGATGAIVYESLAIIEYLERFYPSTLMPADPRAYAIAQTRMHEANDISSSVCDMIMYIRCVPKERRNQTVTKRKWAAVVHELELWERYLEHGHPFLVGSEPYLCDFTVFSNIAYAVRCGLKLDGLYPRLAAYYSRLCNRPSVEKTWPPHWKETVGLPVLRECYGCAGIGDGCCCAQNQNSSSMQSLQYRH